MRVAVVGTGYVGLVTAVGLAELGHTVTCIDIDERKVAALRRGEPPIFERGLEPLLKRNVGSRLSATTDLAAAVADSGPTAASTCPSWRRRPSRSARRWPAPPDSTP
jgi:UDPglucose 6-dehydrogenase